MSDYAMYKGDELLHIGTIEEIAKVHGVLQQTIRFYATPAYRRRVSKREKAENYIEVFKLEDEIDESMKL